MNEDTKEVNPVRSESPQATADASAHHTSNGVKNIEGIEVSLSESVSSIEARPLGKASEGGEKEPPLEGEGEPPFAKAGEGEEPPFVKASEGESKAGLFFDWATKIGLYILALFLPLIFLPFTVNVLELNKQFLLFIFSFVLLVFWLAKVLSQRQLSIKKSLLNIFIVLFAISVLMSSLLAKNIYQTLIGLGGVIGESFLTVVCLVIIYFLASNIFKTRQEFNGLCFVLLASAILAGLFGFLQLTGNFLFSWDFAKVVSFNTIGSANALEIFLAAILVLSVSLFADTKRPFWQLVLLGIAAVGLLFMLISLNFANVWWVLIGVMVMVVGVGIIKQGRASQTRLILAMVVLAMALLLSLTKINISGGWLNVPAEVSPSFKATLDIDKGALADKLFFGTGPGSFAYNWELYRSPLINQTIFWNIRFNQGISKIFSLPATLGMVGTVFWVLMLIFFALWGSLKLISRAGEHWNLAFGFFATWLFLAAMQFFYSTNLTLEFLFWLTLGLSLALIKSLSKEGEVGEKEKIMSLSFRRESPLASVFSFLLVIFLVLTISFFYLGARWWWADVLFAKGVYASVNQNDPQKGSELIAQAINFNSYRDTYLVSLSQLALVRVNQELAKPRSLERDQAIQNLIANAINIGKNATDLNPYNPDNWLQRGIVYQSVLGYLPGAEEWMITSFSEAIKLQPKNPYAFWELGRSYLLLSDYTLALAGQDQEKQAKALSYLGQAEEQFNQAIAVKSDYAPAHYQLALIYDRQGKIDSAIEKMEITKVSFPNDIGIAFQLGLLYYKKQDYERSGTEFERAVAMDENYANARYFLGLIYDRNNEKQRAIEQFERIAVLNPDNQEVKQILDNLRNGRVALEGIVPPAPSPEQRPEVPVEEKKPETR